MNGSSDPVEVSHVCAWQEHSVRTDNWLVRWANHIPALQNLSNSCIDLTTDLLRSRTPIRSNRIMTSRELRRQRREAERKVRKLEYRQSRTAAVSVAEA